MTCGRSWLSPGSLVSSTNKTDRYDIGEILLKVAFNIIKQIKIEPTIDASEAVKERRDSVTLVGKYTCQFYRKVENNLNVNKILSCVNITTLKMFLR